MAMGAENFSWFDLKYAVDIIFILSLEIEY